jgi:hypothetical protein
MIEEIEERKRWQTARIRIGGAGSAMTGRSNTVGIRIILLGKSK